MMDRDDPNIPAHPGDHEDDPQEDLTRIILARTTGSPCSRVEQRLVDKVDGALEHDDSELLAIHLRHCPGCAALESALLLAREILPKMAEIEPDERFVADVLAATVHAPAPARTPIPALVSWWAQWWADSVRRPRFALELAYSGAMLLLLLCRVPSSPLRDVPERALAIVRGVPTGLALDRLSIDSNLAGPVQDLGRGTWNEIGPPIARRIDRVASTVSRTARRITRTLNTFVRFTGPIWTASLQGDLDTAWRLFETARTEMHEFRGPGPPEAPPGKEHRTREPQEP